MADVALILHRLSLAPGTSPLVARRRIAKVFPGGVANRDVDLEIIPVKSTPCWARMARAIPR